MDVHDLTFHFSGVIRYIVLSIRPITWEWLLIAVLVGAVVAAVIRRKEVWGFFLSTYILLLLLSTVILRGNSREPVPLILEPFWSYRAWITGVRPSLLYEVLANILMTIPVGICVSGIVERRKLLWAVGSTVVLEIVIEAFQLILHRGLCETDDVISGVMGALIGYGIWQLGAVTLRGYRSRAKN